MGEDSTVDGLIERVQPDLVATRRAPLDVDEAEAAARLQAQLFGSQADEPPLTIDRYEILGRLGRGGMGVVFAARDAQLGRKVALKLLRQKETNVDPRRLRREARALAQLSHPNIVEIYDVGLHDGPRGAGEIHVVLEYVDGWQLDRWVREETPTWREILDVMVGAGNGLAAAHRAGVIHRDFKPSNLLIDKDGTARVLDFGLAASPESRSGDLSSDHEVPVHDRLTVTGAVLGTPSYMAPEQHLGRMMDERTDQYSFCVTLFEAVWGERPFKGDSSWALLEAKQGGPPLRPPARDPVPRALFDVVVRGLEPDPKDRWPTMDALLQRLQSMGRRRSRGWIAAAGGVFVIGVVAVAVTGDDETDPCDGTEARTPRGRMAAAWSEAARSEIAEAFADAAPEAADTTLERAQPLLSHFAERWSHAFDAWCGASDDQTLHRDRQLSCLKAGLDDFAGLTEVLRHADATVVRHAVKAAASLPSPSRCEDDAVASRMLPHDPTNAAEFMRIRSRLSRARTELAAGRFQEAQKVIDEVAPQVAALEEPRLEYLFLFAKGSVENEVADYAAAADSLERAYHLASAGGDDEVALASARDMMLVLGYRQERLDDALSWSRHGESVLERSSLPLEHRARFLSVRSIVLHLSGRYDDARAGLEEALEIRRTSELLDDPGTSYDLEVLSAVLRAQGESEEALRVMKDAVETRLATLGPDHPDYALAVYNLGVAYGDVGNIDAAMVEGKKALELRRGALPPGHPDIAHALNTLASLHVRRHEYALAKAEFEEAAALLGDKAEGDAARNAYTGLGICAFRMGDLDQALAHYQRVRDAAARGGATLAEANARGNIGNTLAKLDRFDEALAEFDAARKLVVKRYGPEHPLLQGFDAARARAMIEADDLEGAEAIYEEVLARAKAGGNRELRLGLGADLLIARGKRVEARAMVQTLRAEAEAAGEAHNVVRADELLREKLAQDRSPGD